MRIPDGTMLPIASFLVRWTMFDCRLFVCIFTHKSGGKKNHVRPHGLHVRVEEQEKKKTRNRPKIQPWPRRMKKWTRNCDAAKLLKSMLDNGEIAQGDLPKDVYKMREEFQRYPLKTFRNGFYNLKRDTGFHLRENIARINKGIACVRYFCLFVHLSHSIFCFVIYYRLRLFR
jgi:hypothetical protein